MFTKCRKITVLCMLLCVTLLLTGCKQNPSEEKLYERLVAHFADRDFECVFAPVEDGRAVPIYNASAWQSLLLGEEEVLVYFDESNRADYLADGIDKQSFSFVGRLGLRFVLVYSGQDEQVLQALKELPEI